MDPQTDLPDLIEDLEVNIDELVSALTPFLPPSTLSKTASTLPLLSKAHLYTLAAYAIESVLFSALQTSGQDAKNHAIFAELGRLKGYFSKIKYAEEHVGRAEEREREKEGRARLDVGAAQRFIKHGLAGNERYDEMRRERVKGEKERALEKARALTNKTFEDGEGQEGQKRRVDDDEEKEKNTPNKKPRIQSQDEEHDSADENEEEDDQSADAIEDAIEEEQDEDESEKTKPRHRASKNKNKTKNEPKKEKIPSSSTPRATRSTAPKTRSEAFAALASASPSTSTSASKEKEKEKEKGKGTARGKGNGKGKAKGKGKGKK